MNNRTANEFNGEIKLCSVTQRALAKALEITPARINQLIDEGIVVRDELSTSGRVLLFDSLQNFLLSRKATGDGVNYWKEKALNEQISRQRNELKLGKERGELYEATEVDSTVTALLMTLKSRMQGLGHKLSSRLEGLTAAQICDIINAEIYEMLTELSDGAKEMAEDLKADAALKCEPMG